MIKNLESVKDYRPPPSNLTSDTLDLLRNFAKEIEQ
jgi:hypothetical protein